MLNTDDLERVREVEPVPRPNEKKISDHWRERAWIVLALGKRLRVVQWRCLAISIRLFQPFIYITPFFAFLNIWDGDVVRLVCVRRRSEIAG